MTGGKRGSKTVHRNTEYWHKGSWHPVKITAKSNLGAVYVDLYFAGASTPIEVINIWDYRTGISRLRALTDALEPIVDEWIAERDADEVHENPDYPLRRDWLRNYIENNGE